MNRKNRKAVRVQSGGMLSYACTNSFAKIYEFAFAYVCIYAYVRVHTFASEYANLHLPAYMHICISM